MEMQSMPIRVAVPKETTADERRVALDPIVAERFSKLGCEVLIETGAGTAAQNTDAAYTTAKAVASSRELLDKEDIMLKVQPPSETKIDALSENAAAANIIKQPNT